MVNYFWLESISLLQVFPCLQGFRVLNQMVLIIHKLFIIAFQKFKVGLLAYDYYAMLLLVMKSIFILFIILFHVNVNILVATINLFLSVFIPHLGMSMSNCIKHLKN